MRPPESGGANLVLRFSLEMLALGALAAIGWKLGDGAVGWLLVIAIPVGAAVVWGVFNVAGDPSRSGRAPIEVPGWARLGIELVVLGLGAISIGWAWRTGAALVFATVIAAHYVISWSRVQWLLASPAPRHHTDRTGRGGNAVPERSQDDGGLDDEQRGSDRAAGDLTA